MRCFCLHGKFHIWRSYAVHKQSPTKLCPLLKKELSCEKLVSQEWIRPTPSTLDPPEARYATGEKFVHLGQVCNAGRVLPSTSVQNMSSMLRKFPTINQMFTICHKVKLFHHSSQPDINSHST